MIYKFTISIFTKADYKIIYSAYYFYIYIYTSLLLFNYFFNTTYISFNCDILLEFFTHLDCMQPNSRGQDMSYHSLSGTISLGIVSIPYGPDHPETSSLVFVSHIQFVVFNAFTIFMFIFE